MERFRGQGSPDKEKPTTQRNTGQKEQGRPSPSFSASQPEQQLHGEGVNKPELHQWKEMPLARGLNLPGHKQQTGNLDPVLEDAIRRAALGDPEEEARLREGAKKDPLLRQALLHPGGSLAYGPHPPGEDGN